MAIGSEEWVVSVLRDGYQIPFSTSPPLSAEPISLPSYSPSSSRGIALAKELKALQEKGALEPAPQSPGYYSRMFVAPKSNGSWRPIIDLSSLNQHVEFTKFHMETPASVLRSIRPGDWMIFLDLKDAYLQIPIHPASRKFLRFVTSLGVVQFRVLCFGLTTAPQVFTRVMAPVSALMHRLGFRMLRYLDDWLLIGSSREEILRAREVLLNLCAFLGIVINLEKSNLTPSQSQIYLWMRIETTISKVFPTQERILKLLSQLEDFLSSPVQPAALWRSLLGRMSSLSLLIPGARLRMRTLQFTLHKEWDGLNDQFPISWSPHCREDLLWWSDIENLTPGVPLKVQDPEMFLYTDASDQGWGATLDSSHASGLWGEDLRGQSINYRELMAVSLAIDHFASSLSGATVALMCDNSTAISYLKKAGGTKSLSLNLLAQEILRKCERLRITLIPQFVAGSLNVLADSLSRKNQVLGGEWTLNNQVFREIARRWPVMVDLFATSQNHQLQNYFSPVVDPVSLGTDAMLQDWNNLMTYAFPPFGMIHSVIEKLRRSRDCYMTLIAPFWPQRPWFPDLLDLLVEVPVALPLRRDLLRQPHFHHFHQNLHVLHLYAWRLYSDEQDTPASLKRWLCSLPTVEGLLPARIIKQDG